MERSGHLTGGDIRASDRERHEVTDELRAHCATGRISVDEFERRVQRAMCAETIHDLADLVVDLPPIRTSAEPAVRPVLRAGPPGVRPFTYRIVVGSPPERTRMVALDTIAAALNGSGWELRSQNAGSLEFRRRGRERIVIDLEPHGPGATMMVIHGQAPRNVRRQFVALHRSQDLRI